ncbi:MAG: matrixin family metalloprotease [Elusimicrobia bacterium]|nr:matrixin family metalloprotease [Elusimicrobiota bacterium]
MEFDQVYSDAVSWTLYSVANEDYVPGGGTGPFDLPDVATHEHGHIFGLSDLYNSRDKYLTMYGYASAGETLKRTLGKGDILGIQSIY